ncbi:MAG: 2-oxo acid dehydrogenase subunit E2 [Ruminococcaceae bacterium]|nr:2-oxo acid dehydrogenase subunit E2 [Oscillospiraceae bacterium]
MRADGKRLKHCDPMYTVAGHIMRQRTDAMNMITIDIPCEPMQKYINAARKEGRHISHMALILAAYLRTMAKYPFLNRFLVNCKAYSRNEIKIGMVVLKSGQDDGTMSKIALEITDTIDDVNRKINEYVEFNRTTEDNNSTEKLISTLLSIPGLLRVGVPILMWLDKHGLLPKSIIDASPFHASLGITNLASIKTNHIYHHCYNFGTTSVFMAMGNAREVPRRHRGEIVFEKCMPIGVVMDERICSGHDFAIAFRYFSKMMEDPTLLETPPEEVVTDPAL